jgi:hypothetical protein
LFQREPLEGLAQRCAADTKALNQGGLVEWFAALYCQCDDGLPECTVGGFCLSGGHDSCLHRESPRRLKYS